MMDVEVPAEGEIVEDDLDRLTDDEAEIMQAMARKLLADAEASVPARLAGDETAAGSWVTASLGLALARSWLPYFGKVGDMSEPMKMVWCMQTALQAFANCLGRELRESEEEPRPLN